MLTLTQILQKNIFSKVQIPAVLVENESLQKQSQRSFITAFQKYSWKYIIYGQTLSPVLRINL